jgi:hypothetical protein
VDCLPTFLAHAIHIVSHGRQSLLYPLSSLLELLQQHTVELLPGDCWVSLAQSEIRLVAKRPFQRGDLGLDLIQLGS